jgi:hypothetical protein
MIQKFTIRGDNRKPPRFRHIFHSIWVLVADYGEAIPNSLPHVKLIDD